MSQPATIALRTAILQYLSRYIDQHGWAPTNNEICAEVGRSIPALRVHLTALRDQGFIKYTGESRCIALLPGALEHTPQ